MARVRAVRAAVGPSVRLGVDANGGWSVDVALRTIERLRAFSVYFVEQPVAPGDPARLREVRARAGLPIVADESVYGAEDARVLARAGAADVFSIYVGKAGGIGPARKIAAVAQEAGLTSTVGSNLELGVASAAMIHLAMATPGIGAEEFPCDIIGPLYYESDIVRDPLRLGGGRALPPEGPGLGVELDEGMVERYRVAG